MPNFGEFLIIIVVAFVVIGPERLPEYAARARRWIRDLKKMADGAKVQLREQMGPEFDDIDWKAYDPRQYDPRRIVREALLESPDDPGDVESRLASAAPRTRAVFDPTRPIPFDAEAT